jgi:hypothetical protein
MKKLFIGILLIYVPLQTAIADSTPSVDLPFGIGSLQLPWQNPEALVGGLKPLKGGLFHEVYGFDYNILTLGKLASGYRIFDGLLGGVLAVPNSGAQPDAYGAITHDFIQDIPQLKNYATSAHAGFGISYSNAAQGWLWGGSLSYTFGSSSS